MEFEQNQMEIKDVNFYGDELTAIRNQDGDVYVPAKQVVSNLGLDWEGQRKKLADHPVLFEGTVRMSIPSSGGHQDTVLLRVDLLPMLLMTVNPNKVVPLVREKLIRYQKDAARFLSAAFVPSELKSEARVEDELDLLVRCATQLRDQRRAQRELEAKHCALEKRVEKVELHTTGRKNYFTVAAYAAKIRFPLPLKTAQRAGRLASSLCKAGNIQRERVEDSRWNEVKAYPEDVLRAVFDKISSEKDGERIK